MKTVVLDCDDTLVQTRYSLGRVLKRRGYSGPPLMVETQVAPLEYCISLMVEESVLEQAPPEEGAAELVRALKADGYRVEVWAARDWHPKGMLLTRRWLEAHEMEVDDVRMHGVTDSKAGLLGDRTDVMCVVDDNPYQIRQITQLTAVPFPLLIARPWNTAEPGARVERLAEVYGRLQDYAADPYVPGMCW
jgi:hypothetical protein